MLEGMFGQRLVQRFSLLESCSLVLGPKGKTQITRLYNSLVEVSHFNSSGRFGRLEADGNVIDKNSVL
jgi:hypothetical protein